MYLSYIRRLAVSRKLKQGDSLLAERKLRSLVQLYEKLLRSWLLDLESRAWCSYQLGCVYWGEIGDGEKASRSFAETVQLYQQKNSLAEIERTIKANAFENLMILSLSYDEYFSWATRLEELQSENPILSDQRSWFSTMRGCGHAWPTVMTHNARLYWDLRETRDPAQYASAASIYQRSLLHRESLRLARREWREIAIAYCGIVELLVGNCDWRMRESSPTYDPDEFSFILEDALPLVAAYVKTYPADREGRRAFEGLRKSLEFLRRLKKLGVSVLACEQSPFHESLPSDEVEATPRGNQRKAAKSNRLVVSVRQTIPPDEIYWRSSPELNHAVRVVGLSGLRFDLVHIEIAVEDRSGCAVKRLTLTFRSACRVPSAVKHSAGLALRCVVGFTFPKPLAAAGNIQVLYSDKPEYTIRLASGVPMYAYIIQHGQERYGPLQVVSEEKDDLWKVSIIPMLVDLNIVGLQDRFLQLMAEALGPLRGQQVEFCR